MVWYSYWFEQGKTIFCVVLVVLLLPLSLHAADVNFIRAAAEGGNVEAMHAMGALYHHGRGVPRSDAEATKWFLMAADLDHPGSQTIVGMMFVQGGEMGSGKYWLRRAACQGDPTAQRQLELLGKKQK